MSDKVLVTGADGFIGSHLVEALVRSGRDVRAFTFYNSQGSRGWIDILPTDILHELEIVAGDVRDPHSVRDAVRSCTCVFHLAALIGIPYSYAAPDAYVETNVKGTLNVAQASRDLGVEKFVQTSTSEVYGSAQQVPIDEGHPLVGQSPYSASKIGADQIALSFFRSFGTPVAVARPFNTYGPRQSTRAVIPTVITQLANRATTVRLGALEPTRDWTYVEDMVGGLIAVADRDESVGEVINLGSGFEISVGEMTRLVAELMDVPIAIEMDEERLRPAASEVTRLCADTSKARRLLGWEPRRTGLDGFRLGLSETIEWFTDPANLRFYPRPDYAV
jgi:dTDP-glucose 4,6-dehydratase